jgi:hypothetical protein
LHSARNDAFDLLDGCDGFGDLRLALVDKLNCVDEGYVWPGIESFERKRDGSQSLT